MRPPKQVPVCPDKVGLSDHRQQRRDADPSGDEQVALRWDEGEIVARAAHSHEIADLQFVVHVRRPAASVLLAQHSDPVGVGIPSITAQGVLPSHSGGQHQVDVRTRIPVGQPTTLGMTQGQADDSVTDNLLARHRELDLVGHGPAPRVDSGLVG